MNCKLCNEQKELVRSHIIPEFCYQPIYDDKHRLSEYSTDPGSCPKLTMQKGHRQRLLCLDCENKLSRYEKYTREVFYGGVGLEMRQDDKQAVVEGLDYHKFKLWRYPILS